MEVSDVTSLAPPAELSSNQPIERAAAILDIIAREGGAAALDLIAMRAGLSRTTAHPILKTLNRLGYVSRRIGDTRYYLGGRLLNLARLGGDNEALRIRIRPALEAIASKTGETVYLAAPNGDETYYPDAIESDRTLRTTCRVGERERLEDSAIGLVFLAFMRGLNKRVSVVRPDALGPNLRSRISKIERIGFALDLEDHQPDLHCVAVPWRENGEVRAALGLSGPSTRLPCDQLTDIAWMMMKEAKKVR